LSKVVLITGGSRGIGAACALLAARQGWAVAVNYTSNSLAADEVVRQIRQAGGQAITVQADVADEAQVLAMFEKVDAKLGRLDGLVNNAGVVDRTTRVDAMTLERLRRMFEINVFGSFLCAREAVKRMSTRYGGTGGAIVNVSSAAARLGAPGQYVDYASAKGAIDTFTIGLAKEVAAEGIRVNAVRPASSRPTSTPRAACPTAPATWRRRCPCSGPARRKRLRSRLSGCSGQCRLHNSGALLDVAGGR
jgi:NAD(P)-dependent dehydrogenase (short-subunit alcohol dehydrogenase family)